MEWKYWKVVLQYGHVGRKNEVSVARYLVTDASHHPISVMKFASSMPGVKHQGVLSVIEVSREEYLTGKRKETEDLYLQKLKSFRPIIA